MEVMNPVPAGSVPGWEVLDDYIWVEDYLKSLEIRKKIITLRELRGQIKKQAISKADVAENLKNSFKQYQQSRIERLAGRIGEGRRDGDPFLCIDLALLRPYISWEEIEKALELLHDENTITKAAKTAELDRLEKEIAEFKTDLAAISPAKFHTLANARVLTDIRDEFVNFWHNVQGRCNSPCGPRGITLDLSPEPEKAAYFALGVKKAINFDTRQHSYPGTKYL